MRLFKNPTYDFMGVRKTAFMISGVLILASIVSLILHGGPRYGIDFRGGTLLEYRFEDKANPGTEISVPIDEVRNIFTREGYPNAEVKYYGSTQDVAVQVDIGDVTQEIDEQLSGFVSQIQEALPQFSVEERRRESVGPKVGQELVLSALGAIFFSMLLILIYIMFRFEFRFGVGAVSALFHDIIITLGFFSLMDIEITTPVIAALLTIIGYSLNDTIVVFDRIRENLKSFKRKVSNYAGLVNDSINETLSRTIVTSGTTLIVVVVLYLFGGEVIKDFAEALICGIVVGTYSSIFVASPILVEWEARRVSKVAAERK